MQLLNIFCVKIEIFDMRILSEAGPSMKKLCLYQLPYSLRFLPSLRRAYSTTGCDQPIICIPPGSRVYAFGSASQSGTPLIRDFDWTVQDGEAWVVISGTGREKTNIFKASITFPVQL